MTHLEEWKENRTAWLDQDLELMRSDDGWRLVSQKDGVKIWRRSLPDDKNDMFKWVIPNVQADHLTVNDVFVNKLHEYHQYWTKEYTGGYDVAQIDANAKLAYQQYDSGIPMISNRDWLAIQWMREISPTARQVSFRTIVDTRQPRVDGYERIDWWGSHLFEANDDGTTKFSFIDRENQGGNFPAFLMNRMMPKYLIYQYLAIEKFFADGGEKAHDALPPEKNSAHVQGLC